VLIVVIIGTSKIFSTASQITGIGAATTAVLRTGAVIERQMREDLARLSPEGFFVIHCVAVRNDVRGAGAPLLDPTKPLGHLFRADQLVFFANGVQSPMGLRQGAGINRDGQGTASRVYYGHAFQIPNALPVKTVNASRVDAYDPEIPAIGPLAGFSWANQIPPWYPDQTQSAMYDMTGTVFQDSHDDPPGDYTLAPYTPDPYNIQQPPSAQWILARESLVMADDDTGATPTSKVVFLNNNRSLYSIFPVGATVNTAVRKGRVDAVAENLNDIRRLITLVGTNPAPWIGPAAGTSQRGRIMRAMYYPRAEAHAPGMHRVDQALTNNALAIGCSSFRIDWTYDNPGGDILDANGNIVGGTGAALDANGNVQVDVSGDPFSGVRINPAIEHPWFGFTDASTNVYNYGDPASSFVTSSNLILAMTIDPSNIETSLTGTLPNPTNAGYNDYWAVFGYNQTMPFLDGSIDPDTGSNFNGIPSRTYYGVGSGPFDPNTPSNSQQIAFTPWPSAIRVTMTLTDPENKIEGGREFQFVIELPRRVP